MTDPEFWPNKEAIDALLKDDGDAPVAMLNLLKFREKAAYEDGDEPERSGAEAYGIYGIAAAKRIAEVGGHIGGFGEVARTVIGPSVDAWDQVAVAVYPNPKAFLQLEECEEYRAALKHRTAGLAATQVLQLTAKEFGW